MLLVRNYLSYFTKRNYTCLVERYVQPNLVKKNVDVRKLKLKSHHYHYKFVDCLHVKKWGDVDVILTQYIEGIGHKGELVKVSRHTAHYELLPSCMAVFPTNEYLEFYKKDSISLENKTKVSPFAAKTREKLNSMVLQIPMNVKTKWTLNKDHIRIALRYNGIMASNDSILLPENFEKINSDGLRYFKGEFSIQIQINDYTNAKLKCFIVPVDMNKLWESFSMFNKTA